MFLRCILLLAIAAASRNTIAAQESADSTRTLALTSQEALAILEKLPVRLTYDSMARVYEPGARIVRHLDGDLVEFESAPPDSRAAETSRPLQTGVLDPASGSVCTTVTSQVEAVEAPGMSHAIIAMPESRTTLTVALCDRGTRIMRDRTDDNGRTLSEAFATSSTTIAPFIYNPRSALEILPDLDAPEVTFTADPDGAISVICRSTDEEGELACTSETAFMITHQKVRDKHGTIEATYSDPSPLGRLWLPQTVVIREIDASGRPVRDLTLTNISCRRENRERVSALIDAAFGRTPAKKKDR